MAEADYRLMTEATGQRIAAALEALHLATVTGVKGNAEGNYRHGDVNVTPANIGAVAKSGDTMTGPLKIYGDINQKTGIINGDSDSYTDHALQIGHYGLNEMSFYECGGVFNFYRSYQGNNDLVFQINRYNTSSAPLPVNSGGTGATTPAQARANLDITGEEIPLLSNSLAINNDTTQYTASENQTLKAYKFVDLYFVFQGGYTNAIRLCPEYGERTYKFGFFAWHLDDNVIRKIAVAFNTAGRYFTNCVVRMAYGDNGAFNAVDNALYLYKAIGYKW